MLSWGPHTELEREQYRTDIHNNLKAMHWKPKNEQQLLVFLDTLLKPLSGDHRLGAEKFLTALTNDSSRSEILFRHTDWIAELFCTLSNVGFFAVAYHHQDYFALAVGLLSTISHAIPTWWLNRLDVAAAIMAVTRMALPALTYLAYPWLENQGFSDLITPEMLALSQATYNATLGNTMFLTAGSAVVISAALEITIGRKNKDKAWGGPLLHSLWHTTTAIGMHTFNQGLHPKI